MKEQRNIKKKKKKTSCIFKRVRFNKIIFLTVKDEFKG